MSAHVVDRQIAALVGHLRGHHHDFAFLHGGADDVIKAAALVLRQTAHTEALDDESVVVLRHKFHQLPLCAGDQLQKADIGLQTVVKYRLVAALAADVLQEMLILQHRQIGIVDAGKGLKALGIGLSGPRAQNHLAVEHDLHAAAAAAGVNESIGQIALGVGTVKPNGLLRAGQHDGLGAALHQITQRRSGIGHGVRAVADDKAVVAVIVFPDGAGDAQPMLGMNIGAVQTVHLQTIHLTQLRHTGDKA